jgi:HSP20 family molecular chaperone IbpA
MGRDPFEKVPSVRETGPPANIKEHDEYYSLEIPLTGYKKEEVDIIVENDDLIVRGKREEESVNEDVEYILKEYDIDSFESAFRLGTITDQSKITAKFKDGMLYIRLNHVEDKPVKSARKSIPIN